MFEKINESITNVVINQTIKNINKYNNVLQKN